MNKRKKLENNYLLKEVIEELLNLAEDYGEDCPVKIALQPNYPLAARIDGFNATRDESGTFVIWIAAKEATGYAPEAAIKGG